MKRHDELCLRCEQQEQSGHSARGHGIAGAPLVAFYYRPLVVTLGISSACRGSKRSYTEANEACAVGYL